MSKPLRVLIVEDSEDDVLLTIHALKKGGYEPTYERVEDAEAMRKALETGSWDVILCDYQMPKFNGLAAIALLKEINSDIPLIIVSGAIGEETAVECMRLGARDYVMKGNLSRLGSAVERELKEAVLNRGRRQAEEALRESEIKLRLTIDEAPIGVAMVGLDKVFLKCNKAFCDFLGYTEEDLKQKTIAEITFPDDAEIGMEDMRGIMTGGKTSSRVQKRYLRKDRSVVWGEVNINIIRDKQGQPMYFLPLIQDITERRQAEEMLGESEKRYRSLFQNASIGIFHSLPEGKFLRVNPALARMIGYGSPEEMITAVTDIRTQLYVDSKKHSTLVESTLEKSDWVSAENRYRRKDGTILIANLSVRKVLNADGSFAYLEGFVEDITERKQAEESLCESEAKYRTIIEEIEDGYNEVDLNGNFTFFNEPVCKMLGYEREELLGMNNRQYADEGNARKVYQAYNQVYQTGKPVKNFEWQVIRKDGTRRDVEVSISLILDRVGHGTGFRGMARDITDRKRAEKQLQDTLESLRKAVGTTIQVMVSAVETRDPYTSGHQLRSADLALAIAMEMGLPQDKIEGIRMAGSIHDIGKLSIPAEILSKPTKLSDIEFRLIKEHARQGFEILQGVESSWPLAEIVFQHHERMDGSGYPRNLKGDDILIEARILMVADVVEAMASHRPYRPGLGIDAALNEIEKNSGIFYDDAVADACLRLFREKGFKLEGT